MIKELIEDIEKLNPEITELTCVNPVFSDLRVIQVKKSLVDSPEWQRLKTFVAENFQETLQALNSSFCLYGE